MRAGRAFAGLTIAAFTLLADGTAYGAETNWMTAQSAPAKLLPLKKTLFAQGLYTKATGLSCAVKGGKAMMRFSYTTSKTQYYENGIFYAYKSDVFQSKLAKARSLGFGAPVDQCHLVGKKPGQEIFVAIFNKPGPAPKSVTTKNY